MTIASGAKIEFHDASTKYALGFSRIGRIHIGSNVFVGANSIILPNVFIGDNVIIGAGSVVVRDIPENSVAVGNPCRVIKSYSEYIEANKKLMNESKVYDYDYEKMSDEERKRQAEDLSSGGIAFDR